MSTNPVKPDGTFGRKGPETLLQKFTDYGGLDTPQGPEEITDWMAAAGAETGQIVITINAMPDPGDLATWGDGAASIVGVLWRVSGGSPEYLDDTATPISETVETDPELWSGLVAVEVAVETDLVVGPWSDPIEVTIPAGGMIFPALTMAGAGEVAKVGLAFLQFPAMEMAAAGAITHQGAAAFSFPAITISGGSDLDATAGLTFPAMVMSASGTITHQGAGAMTFPAMRFNTEENSAFPYTLPLDLA